jgi:hypothetical protein
MVKGATKPTKRGRKTAVKETTYVVAVESWEWSFGFGLNWRQEPGQPFSDNRRLRLRGQLIHPLKSRCKEVEVAFLPMKEWNEANRESRAPASIGGVQAYRGKLDVLLAMPADVMPSLLAALGAGQVRYAILRDPKRECRPS